MSSYSIRFCVHAGFGSRIRAPCTFHKGTSRALEASLAGSGKCRLCSPSTVLYSVYASLVRIN